ncbi:MAG TPA: glycoside hydrolase family 9 protein [Flavisolibacter sp.]|nr:glycoside hydrolase family 9 protein [Flavisolibacter sp.]
MKSILPVAVLFFCGLQAFAQQVTDRIKINQVGYYPGAPKLAVVTGETDAKNFFITSTNLRDTFFRGEIGPSRKSAYSSTTTRHADFSSLTKAGSYVLLLPGVGHSYVFRIADDVQKETAVATLKGFYYQRISMPLEEKYAGKWHRSAGHPDDIVLVHPSAAAEQRPAGNIIKSPGGWYDAGDYNKYIVNSGITMGTLLSAYEDFPAYFKSLSANIPESGDAIPDLLNEVLYNLRWMLTMQDPFDGGVYHKCTNAAFDGMVMPGVTKEPRYVVQKSTAATLDFAAVTAQAARVFKNFEKQFPKLADSCLAAAQKAWQWAEKNPDLLYDQNELNKKFSPAISTGAYGDRSVRDEWLWAAAELFVTTKGQQYAVVVKERLKDPAALLSWGNVGMLGYYSLIRFEKALPSVMKADVQAMKDSVLAKANTFLAKAAENAFATVIGQSARDYNWGGTSNAANQGILLLQAYALTKKKSYVDGALSNLDYILGRNATGYSFITGAGSKSPMHPHHRPSEADGITEPVPGLLIGGPNIGMQDNCEYVFKEVETAYVDHVCSYASNEIAINWQAPVVYLMHALEAVKKDVGYTKPVLKK